MICLDPKAYKQYTFKWNHTVLSTFSWWCTFSIQGQIIPAQSHSHSLTLTLLATLQWFCSKLHVLFCVCSTGFWPQRFGVTAVACVIQWRRVNIINVLLIQHYWLMTSFNKRWIVVRLLNFILAVHSAMCLKEWWMSMCYRFSDFDFAHTQNTDLTNPCSIKANVLSNFWSRCSPS